MGNDLEWFVDEFLYFRETLYVAGWVFHAKQTIVEMGYAIPIKDAQEVLYHKIEGYGLESTDVEKHHGVVASNCRFSFQVKIETPEVANNIQLVCLLDDNTSIYIDDFAHRKLSADPYHVLGQSFFKMLEGVKGKVLEIGSRNRSGNVRRELIPSSMHYTGMDIKLGENVDVVGDAHALTKLFKPNTFDAIFAMSVFEHLLMPWKVVLEMNRVMKIGGLVMITTHHTWPLHEVPWDYWRFSDQAWFGLFNKYTGFEIIETAVGEPAAIVPKMLHTVNLNLDKHPAYLGSVVLCKKISKTRLKWNVNTEELTHTLYPY